MPLTLRPTGPVSPAQADRQDGRSTKEGQPIGRIYEDGSASTPCAGSGRSSTDPVGRPDHQQREGGKVRKTAKN